MKKYFITIITAAAVASPLLAQKSDEVNENELFANPETVIETKKLDKKEVETEDNKKKIGVSGEIYSVNTYTAKRGSIQNRENKDNEFTPYIDATALADIRLPANSKGFSSFEAQYDPQEEKNNFYMRELFLDFNIGKKVYFRTGKQVLQWGRCYLWNPTDLINIEKKTFDTKIGLREGAYGTKVHIPFGTAVNMYGFADTSKVDNVDQIAGAYKFEFLLGTTEMAFSVWGKKEYHPTYGYDVSTRILGIDVLGEASASYGSNTDKAVVHGDTITTERREGRWIMKASVNFGKSFDFNDQNDKIRVSTEFFYNGDGYSKNFIDDDKTYIYDKTVTLTRDKQTISLPAGNKAYYILGNNLYEPNYHSRYYGALFFTVNKFFISELTLTMNAISNIEHKCFMTLAGLEYADINDFKAGITVNTFIGKKNTEYTFQNQRGYVTLKAGIIY